MLEVKDLKQSAVSLLKDLIKLPSFSGQEDETAQLISSFLNHHGIKHIKKNYNIIATQEVLKEDKPTFLLNSHHDTVKVVNGWTRDPFGATEERGSLFGLGANDAGASLVSLIATFLYFHKRNLPFNLMLAATAEEENFGPAGIRSIIDSELSQVDFGLVGEPTNMEMAIAEKGLLVIDGEAKGQAGHAARQEGENAIYKAMKDIRKIEQFAFDRISTTLGANVMSVTQVSGGKQHNVVPDLCKFVIDLRVNELYSLEEAFEIVQEMCTCNLTARSFNNRSSGVPEEHFLVRAGEKLGIKMFGSATLSDQANMPFPTIKMGPGFSERSHTPDEYIKVSEIEDAIEKYISFIEVLGEDLQVS